MLKIFAAYQLAGFPVFAYFGLLALLCLFLAGFLGFMMQKGKLKISFSWHVNFARVGLILGFAHFILAASLYF